MPTIACPGCGKQYKLPVTAAGQVAKCACGKRFKFGAAPTPAAAATTSSAAKSPSPAKAKSSPAPKPRPVEPVASKTDDDFWDEGLKEPVKPAVLEAPAPAAKVPTKAGVATTSGKSSPASGNGAPKKRKKRKGIKWGFDWGKVAGGLVTFLVFGGITIALAMASGRISIYLAGVAIVGLFTCLSGLMGEEGIW